MSTLIIGALFVIALVALVGLVFVLRSERATPRIMKQTVVPATPIPPVPANEQAAALEQEVPINEALPVLPKQPNQTNQPSPITQVEQNTRSESEGELPTVRVTRRNIPDIPAVRETSNTQTGSEMRVRLNGQFYELANNLRTLHEQAAEMEQRLDSLTNMIDSIERKQGTHGE